MSDLTLADIDTALKRLSQAVADLRNDVTEVKLTQAHLDNRVEHLESHPGGPDIR
jgi:ubiquinone biosynthesis protein UbiJ